MTDIIKNTPLRIVYLLTLSVIIFSCQSRQKAGEGINEGQVIYKITYPPEIESHSMAFLFPRQMSLLFKQDKQKTTLKGNMNIYSLDFIHFNQSDSFFTLLKVLDKKMYVPSTSSGDIFLFKNYSNEQVTFPQVETRKIAGFTCEKAEINPSDQKLANLVIWFTREINLQKPNRNTPFEQIPGVMLEFDVKYQNVTFQFKADKISSSLIDDHEFSIPEGYNKTSIQEIESLIQGVIY